MRSFELFFSAASVLLLLQLVDAVDKRSIGDVNNKRTKSPLAKKESTNRSNSLKKLSEVAGYVGQGIGKFRDQVENEMNEAVKKRKFDRNKRYRNIVREGIIDPTTAAAKVSYKNTKSGLGNFVNDVQTKADKLNKIKNQDRTKSFKARTYGNIVSINPMRYTLASGSVVKDKVGGALSKAKSFWSNKEPKTPTPKSPRAPSKTPKTAKK